MHESAIRAQAQYIYDELSSKNVSAARLKQLSAELDQLDIASRNHQKALSLAGSADPRPNGDPPDGYGGTYGTGVQWKSFGLPNPDKAPQVAAPTMDISSEQIKSLFEAAQAGVPYKVQLGQKDFASSVLRDKTAGAPLTESGLNNALP